MPAIRCEGLTKRYGGRAVVDRLDLEVGEGEVFGFLGPNGSGKTTTSRMLLGLVRPDDGVAWLLGSRVPCPDRLPEVGAMVEEPAFYPWMTGRRNLEVVADEGGPIAAGAIDDALARTGIDHAASTKVRAYSQGMRQRLGLAVALLRHPPLVILDEPTNGMDPAGIRQLRALLRSIADQGGTVFLSSHLMAEVEYVCDRAAVMEGGRLRAVLTLGDDDRQHRVRVRVEPGDLTRAGTALARWAVTGDGSGELVVAAEAGRDVNAALVAAGVVAEAITPERATLEDRFLALTEGAAHGSPAAG